MKVSSIEWHNFRQFTNERIEFDVNSDKKVSVIFGKNYVGKSNLIKSLMWCLYGGDYWDDGGVHVNSKIVHACSQAGQAITSSVTITLEHNNSRYTIKTSQKYVSAKGKDKSGNEKFIFLPTTSEPERMMMKFDASGTSTPIPSNLIYQEIESILPSNLKNYFFYDGENNKIDSVSSKKNLGEAIKTIMNLNAREELIKYFSNSSSNSLRNMFSSQIKSYDSERYLDLQAKIDSLTAEIENIESNNLQTRADIDTLRQQFDQLEKQIEQNADAEVLQQKIQKARVDLKNLRYSREEELADLRNAICRKTPDAPCLADMFIAQIVLKSNINEEYKGLKLIENAYRHQTEDSVDEIINKGVCICGQPITKGDIHYQHLIENKQYLFPHDYSALLNDYLKTFGLKASYGLTAAKHAHFHAKNLKDTIMAIEAISSDCEQYEKDLGDFQGDVGERKRQAKEIDFIIRNKENAISYSEDYTIKDKQSKIEDLLKEQRNLEQANEKNEKIHLYLDYIDAVFDLASKRLSQKKKGIVDALEKISNDVFQEILNKKDKHLKVDPKTYNVEVLQNDLVISCSTGEKIAKNLGFVAGLIYLAKNKNLIGGGDGDEDLPDDYPLFIDAPFSEFDSDNVKNSAEVLPRYCSQLTLTTLDKDYEIAKEKLKDYVDKTYLLKTDQETTDSHFEEV